MTEQFAAEQLVVETRTHRRTALVALRGELDIVTVSKIAEVIDGLEPQANGVRHIALDLRGLTFMDVLGLNELIKQNEYARNSRHNLAVVRGTDEIQRVLELTGVENLLVLVDDPDDLVPPPRASRGLEESSVGGRLAPRPTIPAEARRTPTSDTRDEVSH